MRKDLERDRRQVSPRILVDDIEKKVVVYRQGGKVFFTYPAWLMTFRTLKYYCTDS
jgi:hypothetical protein